MPQQFTVLDDCHPKKAPDRVAIKLRAVLSAKIADRFFDMIRWAILSRQSSVLEKICYTFGQRCDITILMVNIRENYPKMA